MDFSLRGFVSLLVVLVTLDGCRATTGMPVAAMAGLSGGACAVVEGVGVHCWFRRSTFWVPGLADAVSLSVEEPEGCAVRRHGEVACWWFETPQDGVHVEQVPLPPATAVAVTRDQACAVLAGSGQVGCWAMSRIPGKPIQPKMAAGLTDVVGVGIYYGNALALRRTGELVRFAVVESAPGTQVVEAHVPGAVEIAQGDNFSCLRTSGGGVACWGSNWMGRLGDGTLENHPQPQAVPGLAGIRQIAAGSAHACALRADGTILCWGSNQLDQIGVPSLGQSDARPTPVEIPKLRATAVAAVSDGGCALDGERQLVCWGGFGHKVERFVIPVASRPPPPP